MDRRLSLAVDARAPRAARRLLEGLGDELGRGLFARLELLVNELVTHAVVHSETGEASPFHVEVTVEDDVVRAAVEKGGRYREAADADYEAGSAFGMYLIEDQSDRWGIEYGPPLRIWAELVRRPPRRSADPRAGAHEHGIS